MGHREADEFVRGHLEEKFDWHRNNCVTFSTGFVRALHGYDLLGGEGRPKNLREALAQVKRYGTLAQAVSDRLGEPVPPSTAGYGDLVLIPGTQGVGDSLGVCIGSSVLAPGEAGLQRLPMSLAKHAWKTAPKSF